MPDRCVAVVRVSSGGSVRLVLNVISKDLSAAGYTVGPSHITSASQQLDL